MTRKEIKTATNNELLVDYIRSQSLWGSNELNDRGTKRIAEHCKDLEAELVSRGVLTEHDVEIINA